MIGGISLAGYKLKRDERGSIAVLVAIIMPVVLMTVGIGVEASSWVVVKQELQRTADAAALAGALEYGIAGNAHNAAIAAANVAALNGAAGSAAPVWNTARQTLTSGLVTVQLGAGVRNSKNVAVAATVSQTVPLALAGLMTTALSITLSATGWAETNANAQPCVLALDPHGNGVTVQGNPTLALTGCTVRSNASISTGGSASMTAAGFYANGMITGSGINGTLHPNDGTSPDPYATDAAVQAGFANLLSGAGAAFSDKPNATTALSPGPYSGWDINGTVSLRAGIYYINGNIVLGAQASVSGTGVTIVTSGALSMTGGAALTISAAEADATSGAIPGVVFASNSTVATTFGGTSNPSLTGVVYFPNADLSFSGNTGVAAGCLEVIAKSVSFHGDSSLAANCTSYSALSFGSDTSPGVALVQ